MSATDNLHNIRLEILTICDAASQLLKTYDDAARGKQVVFSADYSLVAGYVRPSRSPNPNVFETGFDRNIDHVGKRIFQFYSKHGPSAPYKIAFSQPTIIEFSASSERLQRELQGIEDTAGTDMDALYDAFMRYVEGSGSLNGMSGDYQLYQKAKQTFELFNRTFDERTLSNLLSMIKEKKILGLGCYFTKQQFDLIKPDVYEHTRDIWDYLNENRRGVPFNTLII